MIPWSDDVSSTQQYSIMGYVAEKDEEVEKKEDGEKEEEEERHKQKQELEQEEQEKKIRPLRTHAKPSHNVRRRPCRYQACTDTEDPRKDDSNACQPLPTLTLTLTETLTADSNSCHPWTIAVAVGNRVDDLDVAFNGDDHQTAYRGVAD